MADSPTTTPKPMKAASFVSTPAVPANRTPLKTVAPGGSQRLGLEGIAESLQAEQALDDASRAVNQSAREAIREAVPRSYTIASPLEPDPPAEEPRRASPGPPKHSVEFEFDGIDIRFRAKFHKVVVDKDERCVVLVTDTRHEADSAVVPQASDRPLAISIPGMDKIYAVESKGYEFPLDSYTLIVLPIIRLDEEEPQEADP